VSTSLENASIVVKKEGIVLCCREWTFVSNFHTFSIFYFSNLSGSTIMDNIDTHIPHNNIHMLDPETK